MKRNHERSSAKKLALCELDTSRGANVLTRLGRSDSLWAGADPMKFRPQQAHLEHAVPWQGQGSGLEGRSSDVLTEASSGLETKKSKDLFFISG